MDPDYRKFLDDHRDIAGILEGRKTFIGPDHVVIDPTNNCDNNCIGCWTRSPLLGDKAAPEEWRKQQLPYETMISLIDDLAAMGAKRIRFTGGGEPFVHPRIMDLLAYVKQKDLICAVTTNFSAVSEKRARTIGELGVDEVTISLWAGTANIYSRSHPNKTEKSFEKICQNLKVLSGSMKPEAKVILANVIFSMNFMDIIPMLDLALEVGASGIYFTLVDSIASRTDGLLLNREMVAKVAEDMEIVRKRVAELPVERDFLLDNFDGFMQRLNSGQTDTGNYDLVAVDEIPCYIGWHFIRVLPNGDVAPCCRGVDKPMGNLLENSFSEIWNSSTYDEFRSKALTLKKSDPYFAPIGCYRCCDNLMHNRELHRRLTELSEKEKEYLVRDVCNQKGKVNE